MNKIVRTSAPQWLKDKCEDWGKKWEKRYAEAKDIGKSIRFNWPQVDKEKVDKKLRPLLSEMTKAHCSFCDAYNGKICFYVAGFARQREMNLMTDCSNLMMTHITLMNISLSTGIPAS